MKKVTCIILSVIMILNIFCALGITVLARTNATQSTQDGTLKNKFVAVIYCWLWGDYTLKEVEFSSNGTLTYDFPDASYVFVRNYDTGVQYCTDGWSNFANPVTLVNQAALTQQFDKMYVPEGTHTLQLTDNGNDIFTLGYDTDGTTTETTQTTQATQTTQDIGESTNTYTINYELCSGTGELPSQIKIKGTDLKLSSMIPTHTKYTFAYWISSDKKTKYSAGSTYKADANDTLYAVWKEVCSKCKGSPYSSVKCDKCNGSKYYFIITCDKCKGKGKITKTLSCGSCKGTGKKTKTHKEDCSNCKGLGAYYGYGFDSNGNFGWGILPCPYCQATGKVEIEEQVTCKTCDGNGKVESEIICSSCEGLGGSKTICEKCEGTGTIKTICDKCHGIDSIIYHFPNCENGFLEHDWDNGTVTKQPTCTETGEKIYHCEICKHSKTATLSVLGHNFSDEYTVDKAATCTQDGIKSRHCSRCEAYTDEVVIEKLGHNYSDEFTVDKEATCTQDGSKSRHCSRCDACTDETVIEKLGHNFANYTSDGNATCTEDGTKTGHCTRCHAADTIEDLGSAKGHCPSTEWTVTKPATETETGVMVLYCEYCGEILETQQIPVIEPQHQTSIVAIAESSKIYVGGSTYISVSLTNGSGQTKFTSNNTKVATVNSTTGKVTGKKAGTAIITAKNNNASSTVRITVVQKANPIKVTGKTVKIKAAKATTIAKTKAYKITNAKGTVTFKKASGNSKFTVNKKNGKITVKKGLKKGTYKVKVKVTATGNTTYKADTKTATVKIIVK